LYFKDIIGYCILKTVSDIVISQNSEENKFYAQPTLYRSSWYKWSFI